MKPVNSETLVTHNDETKTLQQWAAYYGYEYKVIYSRYKRGCRGNDLFRQPRTYKHKRVHEYPLPKGMDRRETLLCALDDYYRDEVMHYSKEYNVSEWELVTIALDHLFKRIKSKQAASNPT